MRTICDLTEFSKNRRAHLVGIAGSGMSSLARLLADMGWSLSGSDLCPNQTTWDALRRRGIAISFGHKVENLPIGVDLLIHSASVPFDNAERACARARSIPELSYGRMLGELTRSRRTIGIAGTHGKSTTAALVSTILLASGLEPSACFGAELCDCDSGGWAGAGDLFVVESCEYRRSFLDQSLQYAAMLNVEPDHFDSFRNFADIVEAFRQFAARISPEGLLVVGCQCAAALEAARACPAAVETLAVERDADWQAIDVRPESLGTRFIVRRKGHFFAEFRLPLWGRHNVFNALAATALASSIGIEAAQIGQALSGYGGIRRRFEIKSFDRGIIWMDDYAHHPTEVRATLQAARDRFRHRRLWCAFQPHQLSRTRLLLEEFGDSFGLADEALIAPVFAAREPGGQHATELSRLLAARICASGGRARFCGDLDRIATTLDDETRPGDVVLTMGAGDLNQVHHAIARRFPSNRAS